VYPVACSSADQSLIEPDAITHIIKKSANV